jgi:hypothetical protein
LVFAIIATTLVHVPKQFLATTQVSNLLHECVSACEGIMMAERSSPDVDTVCLK